MNNKNIFCFLILIDLIVILNTIFDTTVVERNVYIGHTYVQLH
jgi:hypothetical protein